MINHINVERLAGLFTGFFVDLNFNDKLDDVTFLEILLGFMYGYKKVLKTIEMVEILTPDQIAKIDEVLNKTIEEEIKIEPNSGLYKLLEQIKGMKEEKDVERKDE